MAKSEYPVIGMLHVNKDVSESEEVKYAKLWEEYGPKIRKVASTYARKGEVGGDLEDLMAQGQWTMLHAIRLHNAELGKFSTFFYTLLKNRFKTVSGLFPFATYLITGTNLQNGQRITTLPKRQLEEIDGEIVKGDQNLEARIQYWRAQGFTIAVRDITRKHRKHALHGRNYSLDYIAKEQTYTEELENPVKLEAEVTAHKSRPSLAVSEIMEVLHRKLPEDNLRKIAILLFNGEKAQGGEGFLSRLGITYLQYQRDLRRIKMLLAGEFGIKN